MDLKQHLHQVDVLTQIFCLQPTIGNLDMLRNAVKQMELTCEELIVGHPDSEK